MSNAFNFFQQWYPISPLEDLDPVRPIPFTLLGLKLVIWKPRSASHYRVFLDQCPHRLAPLSEGRVDETSENLMCSYHGWEFDPQGNCTRIPQADTPDLIATKGKNFCVTAFPVQEANDLLWVWPDAQTADLAEQTPLPLSPQLDASKGFVWSSVVRDLEYDWQTLVENVADPSHVAFAHHGIQGNRKRATALPIEILTSTAEKIEAKIDQGLKSVITFEPPCRLEYAIFFGNEGKQVGLVTYCIPMEPGKSRIVAQFPRNFAQRLQTLTPRWWDHIRNRNLVLEGDMILLHQQERYLQQHPEPWQTAFKLPTRADRLVIEFRRWFDRYCQGQLPWGKATLPRFTGGLHNRQHILDRYHQHTQHCSSCRSALQWTQRLQWICLTYILVALSATALLPDALRIQFGIPLMAMAGIALGFYGGLKGWLEPQFYFVDYIHADRK